MSCAHDGDYRNWAQDILASRAGDSEPIYVRTAWELGGEWMSITAAANADPNAFRGAFQHFAKAFHDASPRFKIVFDTAGDRPSQEHLYPGDASIDVISQDIYWQTQYHGTDPAKAFEYYKSGMGQDLDWMTQFAAAHGKPMAISEWGVPGDAARAGLDGATFVNLMDNWIDTHNVVYANYWNDGPGSGYDGLISDGVPAASGAALKAAWADRGGDTTTPTPPPPPPPQPPTTTTPVNLTSGTGVDTLVLKISQDAYQGNAQYTVFVDNQQVGGVFSAAAAHTAATGDATDTLTIKGNWTAGNHTAEVRFLNDAWGGSGTTDRNLYVEGATIDGASVPNSSADLFSQTGFRFSFTDVDAAPPPPPPATRPIINGTNGIDTINVGDAKASNVDAGKSGDRINLGANHDDIHLIMDRGEVRGDAVVGFKPGVDLLEFHGFGQGKVTPLGDGDFKVYGADGKGETFYLEGVTTLSAQDYTFV